MEWIIVCAGMLVLLICAGVAILSVGEVWDEEPEIDQVRHGGVADAREAHYMANFWNYDGSVQHDWEE